MFCYKTTMLLWQDPFEDVIEKLQNVAKRQIFLETICWGFHWNYPCESRLSPTYYNENHLIVFYSEMLLKNCSLSQYTCSEEMLLIKRFILKMFLGSCLLLQNVYKLLIFLRISCKNFHLNSPSSKNRPQHPF